MISEGAEIGVRSFIKTSSSQPGYRATVGLWAYSTISYNGLQDPLVCELSCRLCAGPIFFVPKFITCNSLGYLRFRSILLRLTLMQTNNPTNKLTNNQQKPNKKQPNQHRLPHQHRRSYQSHLPINIVFLVTFFR